MRKRFLTLIFALLLLFVMPSCEEDDPQAAEDIPEIEICEHQSGEWIISDEPDCTTAGSKYAECIKCGEVVETQVILALGHSFKDGQCSTCGKKYNMDLEFVSFGNGTCFVASRGECTDKEIVIPPVSPEGEKVVVIGEHAFSDEDIISIEIGDNVTDIYNCAFEYCRSLKTVIIGNKVEGVGEYVFRECSQLDSVSFGNNVVSIGYEAFYNCDMLTYIELPATLSKIGIAAFAECSGLAQVIIPSGNVPLQICEEAFAECIMLSEIVIPDNAISIDNCAFDGCIRIKYAYIGNGISEISEYAFRECRSLGEIVIGKNVQKIAYQAFHNCRSLTSVQIPVSVTTISAQAFIHCAKLEKLSFDSNSRLETIGDSAFANCEKLRGVELPDSLTSLENCAFDNCTSLEYVVFGDNLRVIPEYAFRDCHALTLITFGSSIAKIEYEAFYNCRSLEKVRLNYGATEIKAHAFGDCVKLNQLVLSSTVNKVAYSAFEGCEVLRRVYFEGNQKQWERIDFGGNTHFAFDTPFYYSENKAGGDTYYYTSSGDAKLWNLNTDSFYTEEYRLDFLEICGDNVIGDELVGMIWQVVGQDVADWEAGKIVSDPTYVFDPNDGYLSKKDLYKSVLFDLMLGEDNALDSLAILEDTSVGLMKDIATVYNGGALVDGLTHEDFEALLKFTSIADLKGELKNMFANDYLEVFDMISSCVGNAYEAAMAFSRYYALRQLSRGYIEILSNIAQSGAFPDDMRRAAEELIEAYEYAFAQTSDKGVIKYQIAVFLNESAKDLDKWFREKTVNAMILLDNSLFLQTIKFTGKALTLVMDLLNFDQIAETYYNYEGLVYIRQVLHAYIEALPDCDYLKQANRESAVLYMNAIELYQKAVLLENEYAKDAFAAYRDKPGGWADDEVDELLIKIDNNTITTASLYKQYDDAVRSRYNRYLAR